VNVKTAITTTSTERKGSRGGIYSVSKTEKSESDKKTTPKVIRNGSVKELKEKLIRKNSSSKVTHCCSHEHEEKRSSVERDSGSYSVTKHYKTSSEGKSFLNSNKKAGNVKEIMTYMKNADGGEFSLIFKKRKNLSFTCKMFHISINSIKKIIFQSSL
jgi:hypothetical protein